jgi:hypothetical protein
VAQLEVLTPHSGYTASDQCYTTGRYESNEKDIATPQALQARGKGSILHSNGLQLAFSDAAGVSMQLPYAHNRKAYQNWHTRKGITKAVMALKVALSIVATHQSTSIQAHPLAHTALHPTAA